jgi:hypothetical protein
MTAPATTIAGVQVDTGAGLTELDEQLDELEKAIGELFQHWRAAREQSAGRMTRRVMNRAGYSLEMSARGLRRAIGTLNGGASLS